MGMTFNEFQRELQKRNIDGPIALVLTAMYEQQRETAEQVHQMATIVDQMANSMAGLVQLHETTQGGLVALQQRVRGDVDGVSLNSVPLRDEDE